jgi:hypothetical protein
MPHVVVKAAAVGSTGDLAKITEALQAIPVNIVAIGGGEAVIDDREIGVVSMIVDPDDSGTLAQVVTALTNLTLNNNRHLAHIETFPNIHIEVPDKAGELKKALDAVAGINIRSVLSMGTVLGLAHVGLGFADDDCGPAEAQLIAAGIHVDPHEH